MVVNVDAALVGRLRGPRDVNRAAYPRDTIWICCCNHRFLKPLDHSTLYMHIRNHLIHITDRPAFSKCEVDREIASLEVAPRPRRILYSPLVVGIAVESSLIICPAIIASYHALSRVGPSSAHITQVEW
jgi:hypothetical protein